MNTTTKTKDIVKNAKTQLDDALYIINKAIPTAEEERPPFSLEAMKHWFLVLDKTLTTIALQILVLQIERKRSPKFKVAEIIDTLKVAEIIDTLKIARTSYRNGKIAIKYAKSKLSKADREAIEYEVNFYAYNRNSVSIDEERIPWVDEDLEYEAWIHNLHLYSEEQVELYDFGCPLPQYA
jgi:hypothetical protein